MNYTLDQIKTYAELLSFTASEELMIAFSDQQTKDENEALATFHREVAVLASLWEMQYKKKKNNLSKKELTNFF